MRSFKSIFLLFSLLVVVFSSCRRVEDPETVTRKFANHFLLGEYDRAKQYGTESTVQMLEMMETLASIGQNSYNKNNVTLITEEDIECRVNGERAMCSYVEYGELVELPLVLVGGRWLVDFSLDQFLDDDDWYEDDENDEDDWNFDGTEIQL